MTRYCPVCGLPTDAPFCPEDGVATLERVKAAGSGEVKNGDLVAKYRISGKLGKGGFGAVFSAVHTGTGQSVALKMLLSEDADESEIRRFHREARITAGLQHPNTVRVFDVGQTESGSLYIAMELLQGGSLEEELRQRGAGGILTQTEAIELAIPVLKALSEAHSQSLVHRDLKPGNIMYATIDGERVVKVLDFGIARINDSSLTGTGRSLGTPAYMSPEQVLGGNLDGRSDLYALGVILYRCVAGKLPFSDPNPLSVLYSHMHVPAPDLAATARTPVSVAFVDLVMRALAKEPDRRFANAREMRIALEAIRGLPEAVDDSVSAPTQSYPTASQQVPPLKLAPASKPGAQRTPGPQRMPRPDDEDGSSTMAVEGMESFVIPRAPAAPMQPAPARPLPWIIGGALGLATIAAVAWVQQDRPAPAAQSVAMGNVSAPPSSAPPTSVPSNPVEPPAVAPPGLPAIAPVEPAPRAGPDASGTAAPSAAVQDAGATETPPKPADDAKSENLAPNLAPNLHKADAPEKKGVSAHKSAGRKKEPHVPGPGSGVGGGDGRDWVP